MGAVSRIVPCEVLQCHRKVTTISLSREVQGDTESLLKHIDRFRDRTMEYYNNIAEEDLVQLYVHSMVKDYYVHLINHSFKTFSDLLVAARNLAKDVRPAPRTY